MSGYVRKRRIYDLDFSERGEEYAGLEVRASSITMDQVLELSANIEKKIFGALIAEEDLPALKYVIDLFSGALVEWNLTDADGKPVPATSEGLRAQDPAFFRALVLAWADALMGVSPPLEQPSSGGDPSLEQSIPMEVS